MMVLACMSTVLLQGMENPDHNTLSFLINQTTVKLTKGCMFDADGKIDLMVVGRVQQMQLQPPRFGDSLEVGRIYTVRENMIYIKNKDDESASDDDTYKPYATDEERKYVHKKEIWTNAHKKAMQSNVLSVVEPRIRMKKYDTESFWSYYAERANPDGEGGSIVNLNSDKKAVLEEATKDLVRCYNNVLNYNVGKHKSIAISALGTDVGFPREDAAPVAVATILEFIKTSGNDGIEPYALIHLFVKKRSEFARYKELLAEYAVEQK